MSVPDTAQTEREGVLNRISDQEDDRSLTPEGVEPTLLFDSHVTFVTSAEARSFSSAQKEEGLFDRSFLVGPWLLRANRNGFILSTYQVRGKRKAGPAGRSGPWNPFEVRLIRAR